MLDEFQPRLVGSVLTGTATAYSDINLHLFADASESVAIRLLEIGVPHEFYERRVKMDAERSINYPALRFEGRRPHGRRHRLPHRRHTPIALLARGRPAHEAGGHPGGIRAGRRELTGHFPALSCQTSIMSGEPAPGRRCR